MSYANLFLSIWELGRFLLGNLARFYLGTWTDFAWEVGRFLLGNLDEFHLGSWLVFTTYLYIPQHRNTKKGSISECVFSML